MSCTRVLLALAATAFAAAACSQQTQSGSDASTESFSWALFGPSREFVLVPQGTVLRARLDLPLNSASSYPGEPFMATVVKEIRVGDELAVPEGTTIHGIVREASPAVRGGGDALLSLEFREFEFSDGSSASIEASLTRTTESKRRRNTAIIGGSAAGGALLGRILGKNTRGALVGTIVGGAVGTGIVMAKEGEQVNLPDGTLLTIRLEAPVKVPSQSSLAPASGELPSRPALPPRL